MIQAKRLTRTFGSLVAVDRLDLTVERGEVLGFLGPNGAGKTTTVRMLAGLIAPSSGTAVVNGMDVVADPEGVRSSVGLLTESPGMYEKLSAKYNLQIFGSMYDVPNLDKQVERYLRLVGLWDRRDDPVAGFSKGMKQKLAICRALLHEPPLIFLDEPTSALDPEASLMVREFIEELKSKGRTIFLTTHNLDEAERLCDRVAIFKSHLLIVDAVENLRQATFGTQVDITLRHASDDHVRCIEQLPQGLEVARKANVLRVRVSNPDEDNPAIICALVALGAQVVSVEMVDHSLEKIYLELLQGLDEPDEKAGVA